MPVYVVTGKLGSGKTICAVGRMQEYLGRGRRVATNIDLELPELLRPDNKSSRVIRVPDKPTSEDLDMLGFAYEGDYDEDKSGLLVLDELASWLNSRSWNDKSRKGVIEWFIHARKFGWDVILVVQDVAMIDAQVRSALCEHLVVCKRTDRMRIPVLGWTPPKGHVASVYYGESPQPQLRLERWWYRNTNLYKAYDTRQAFTDSYAHGTHSVLPPGYLPRAEPETKAKRGVEMKGAAIVAVVVGVLGWVIHGTASAFGWFGSDDAVAAMAGDLAPGTAAAMAVVPEVQADGNPVEGWRYTGTFETGGGSALHYFEDAAGVRVLLHESTLARMGVDVVDRDVGRLIVEHEGRVITLGAPEL